MNVAALIGIMIGIVVGVNLISPVNNVVQTVTTPTYASSVVSLTGVLPIIFVTVIILGAIAWILSYESVPSYSNVCRITARIRRTLNPEMGMSTPSQAECKSTQACVTTRGAGSLWEYGIVYAL